MFLFQGLLPSIAVLRLDKSIQDDNCAKHHETSSFLVNVPISQVSSKLPLGTTTMFTMDHEVQCQIFKQVRGEQSGCVVVVVVVDDHCNWVC